uniref:Chlorophyll a-b binding protein, chloroplastic n=1 Tax=Setaria viridis TaxID=4556 RepID=A0A4U6U2Y4_SETVI|nr:hypothetical protein SEVIR_6G129408v2 [Setaria viridis]
MAMGQLLLLATSPGAGAGKQVPVRKFSPPSPSSSAKEPSAPRTRRRYSAAIGTELRLWLNFLCDD